MSVEGPLVTSTRRTRRSLNQWFSCRCSLRLRLLLFPRAFLVQWFAHSLDGARFSLISFSSVEMERSVTRKYSETTNSATCAPLMNYSAAYPRTHRVTRVMEGRISGRLNWINPRNSVNSAYNFTVLNKAPDEFNVRGFWRLKRNKMRVITSLGASMSCLLPTHHVTKAGGLAPLVRHWICWAFPASRTGTGDVISTDSGLTAYVNKDMKLI